MHRNIKRFGVEGYADSGAVVGLRETQEHIVLTMLRDKGYVPVLGLGPYFSLDYDFEVDKFRFVVSAYGVFVGSEGVKEWMGADAYTGQLQPIPTPPSTLKTSLTSLV